MSDNYSRDPDDLHGDTKVAVIEIACRRNGSMSIAGSINDLPYALAMLDNARDSLVAHHARQTQRGASQMITPAKDLSPEMSRH